eukprot:5443857-Amphidinium_carterae.1
MENRMFSAEGSVRSRLSTKPNTNQIEIPSKISTGQCLHCCLAVFVPLGNDEKQTIAYFKAWFQKRCALQ